MSEHTPQHDISNPTSTFDTGADARADPAQADLVAGDPPVPLTVWRTARTLADAGRGIGARLAARLVAAYSRPGEAVVDLTDDHAPHPGLRGWWPAAPPGVVHRRCQPDHRPGHADPVR